MKKFVSKIPAGRIAAQIFSVGGARAAYDFVLEVGRADLAEKISHGEFSPPRVFGPEAAKARAQALVWLAKRRKAA